MTINERMDYAARRKKEMNCCQAVLVAFASELGRSEEELLRLGSGFGSGMGTMDGTCGALVGAIMVSSLLSEKGAAMTASRTIMPRFKELCGATVCRDLKGIGTGRVLCSCENCVRNAVQAAAERNFQNAPSLREKMRLFEKCINTNDLALGRELIAADAPFDTPVSPEPLYGAEGYLSVVALMRRSFPDVQWKLVSMVADGQTVAVQWKCTGTFSGSEPFAGIQPNGRKFATTVMNFYSFDLTGKICKDIAAVGIAGILRDIGAIK